MVFICITSLPDDEAALMKSNITAIREFYFQRSAAKKFSPPVGFKEVQHFALNELTELLQGVRIVNLKI
ncbi:MAG: hypothetical protein EBS11_27850 [Janthinobacterium sp.]|nr:hypothetical protein [Janthinobacterium sp.]